MMPQDPMRRAQGVLRAVAMASAVVLIALVRLLRRAESIGHAERLAAAYGQSVHLVQSDHDAKPALSVAGDRPLDRGRGARVG